MLPNDDDLRWNYLREQIEATSIHGIPKIFGSQFAITKTVWVVVFVIASAGCCGHGYVLFKNFFDYPTKVHIHICF